MVALVCLVDTVWRAMTSSWDHVSMTTEQIASTPRQPGGAMVAVISESPGGPRHLLLHRAEDAPGVGGDWAWGSPSGCLEPGEDIATCAARELFEETGIRGEPQPVATEDISWALFFLHVPWGTAVRLDAKEHNDFTWVTFEEACGLCRPEPAVEGFRIAVEAARRSATADER